MQISSPIRYFVIGSLSLLALAERGSSQSPHLPFAVGEKLNYRVSVSKMGKVGNGSMWIEGPVDVRGVSTWLLRFDFEAGVGPMKAVDRTSSWLDPLHMAAQRYFKHEKHVLSKRDEKVEIFPSEKRWAGADGASGISPTDEPLDELSFIYFIRTLPLIPDTVYRVARHYGLTGVNGPQFRWVTLTDKNRLGLLGKGAVLMKTSYPDRTSPVLRGAWVLEKIIGTPPTPPPPGVETDLSQRAGEKPATVRARLEQHRASATCRQCHGVIDPMGLALENFDAVGKWRMREAGAVIDASGELGDGTRVDGVVALRKALLSKPEVLVGTFTEKLMTYGLGRGLEYYDMPAIRTITREAAKNDNKFSSFVLGIVKSAAFQMSTAEPATTDASKQN